MTNLNGVDFKRTGNPQADLVTYANARGISQAEAKKELEAEFGVAKAVANQKDDEVVLDTTTLNGVEFTKTGDPEADLAAYADARGISKAEARKELEAEFGVPKAASSSEYEEVEEADSTEETEETEEAEEEDSTETTSSDSSSSTSSTSSSSSSSSSSSDDGSSEFTKDADGRKKLEKCIQYWNAKLKEATDAKDDAGVARARVQSQKYQTLAKKWDKG